MFGLFIAIADLFILTTGSISRSISNSVERNKANAEGSDFYIDYTGRTRDVKTGHIVHIGYDSRIRSKVMTDIKTGKIIKNYTEEAMIKQKEELRVKLENEKKEKEREYNEKLKNNQLKFLSADPVNPECLGACYKDLSTGKIVAIRGDMHCKFIIDIYSGEVLRPTYDTVNKKGSRIYDLTLETLTVSNKNCEKLHKRDIDINKKLGRGKIYDVSYYKYNNNERCDL